MGKEVIFRLDILNGYKYLSTDSVLADAYVCVREFEHTQHLYSLSPEAWLAVLTRYTFMINQTS